MNGLKHWCLSFLLLLSSAEFTHWTLDILLLRSAVQVFVFFAEKMVKFYHGSNSFGQLGSSSWASKMCDPPGHRVGTALDIELAYVLLKGLQVSVIPPTLKGWLGP